ncbi:MAG TPA: YicC family protein, partial [Candidatus Cloacimonas sp.]|nr:YicC family protein [Candidatus Cloacimonas sp.]
KFQSSLSEQTVGKKLNFILQEMHRETNTIGSKFNTNDTFEHILTMKEEIEKCREIVQNVQ